MKQSAKKQSAKKQSATKRWLALILFGLVLAPTMSASAPVSDLHAFERGSWQQLRNAHAGKPLIVHFWGVTCGPCRVEMPQWGQFLRQHPDLLLVTIDADLVPNDANAVKSMLRQSGLVKAENWMFDDDFVERLRYEIDPHWQGDIPRTLLIARDGRTTTIEGVVDFARLASWWRDQSSVSK
jgi:thiol-disulfide isomerase/thioredoxin